MTHLSYTSFIMVSQQPIRDESSPISWLVIGWKAETGTASLMRMSDSSSFMFTFVGFSVTVRQPEKSRRQQQQTAATTTRQKAAG